MDRNTGLQNNDAGSLGWRYCYECVAPATGSRLRILNEAEAYFWFLLGYEVRRMVEPSR